MEEEAPYQIEFEKPIEQNEEKFVADPEPIQETQVQLELTTESEDFDEMSVQLNPDAKEFVPVSPTRTVPLNNLLGFMDPVVAQSPMKGDNPFMEDNITLPSETDFDYEAEVRPHELEEKSTEFMNLKEAMQQDDKLEQGYTDETQHFQQEVKEICEEYAEKEKSFSEYSNGFQNTIDDAMNRSFYEGRDDDLMTEATQRDILNKCQPIPTFDDEDTEEKNAKQFTNGTAESEVVKQDNPAFEMGDSSDFFEPEKFVEEIKKANGDVDKYTDQELSPTFEVSPSLAAPPQLIIDEPVETKETEQISSATPSENTVQEQIPQQEVVAEPVVEIPPVVIAKATESKAEKKSTSSAKKTPSKPATSSVSQVKSSPAVSSARLSTASKSPAVSKSPAATRSPALTKVDSKTAAKTAAAAPPVQAKPPPIRKPTSATATAPKLTVAAAPAKPKAAVPSTQTTVRKAVSSTVTSSSITAPKSATLLKKTSTTSSVAPK